MPDPVKIGVAALFGKPVVQANIPEQALPVNLDFSGEQTYQVNLGVQQGQNVVGTIKTVYLENGNNPNNVTVRSTRTGFRTIVPAYANAYLPIVSIEGDTLEFYSLGGTSDKVAAMLYNYFIHPFVWYTTDPLAPGFQVEVVDPTATSITNRDNTLVSGVAEDVFPAVASPRNCWFTNMGDSVVNWIVNGTATGVEADMKQINPGQTIVLPYRTPWRISFFQDSGAPIFIQAEEWASS
jgi:hypothetical protein